MTNNMKTDNVTTTTLTKVYFYPLNDKRIKRKNKIRFKLV